MVLAPIRFRLREAYDPGRGHYCRYVPGSFDALGPVQAHQGYLLRMSAPAELAVEGMAAPTTLALRKGWNLSGFPIRSVTSVDKVLAATAGAIESVWSYDPETHYYPFGRPRLRTGTDPNGNRYLYTGKELDRESGLMYYEARYMDPVIGRFVSVDPLYSNIGRKPKEKEIKRQRHFNRLIDNPQELSIYSYTTITTC